MHPVDGASVHPDNGLKRIGMGFLKNSETGA